MTLIGATMSADPSLSVISFALIQTGSLSTGVWTVIAGGTAGDLPGCSMSLALADASGRSAKLTVGLILPISR